MKRDTVEEKLSDVNCISLIKTNSFVDGQNEILRKDSTIQEGKTWAKPLTLSSFEESNISEEMME